MTEKLFEHVLLEAGSIQKPSRLDVFVSQHLSKFSRTAFKQLCIDQKILVNRIPTKASYIVKSGDIISILNPYENWGSKPIAENIPLHILYEDEYLMVVNKQAGMAVHPGLGDYTHTLLHALLHHQSNEYTFVHRIDKHTSGIIAIAKSPSVAAFMQKQFIDHSIKRTYVCLVWGQMKTPLGTIDTYMGRNPINEKIIQVAPNNAFGKRAITHYHTLDTYPHASLVQCTLDTGRTHQIRIHMQHIGHALVGDQRYPNHIQTIPDECMAVSSIHMTHQALHAQELGFYHPITNEYLLFEVAPPDNFIHTQQLLSK